MAPARTREPSIERTQEYEEFMEKLEEYHKKRGTNLEREPKVGSRHVDLLRLYKKVLAQGGYDIVSDAKGNKLAWRKLGQEFNLGTANLPAQAFMLKTAYYRNLAAFEISEFHKKEPPPKEILEDTSAKGGNLLTRTMENFNRPISREAENLTNGQGSEDDTEEAQKTPKEEKTEIDEAGSNAGRVTRGLRHAPPQRVLFQPDLSSSRQTRQTSSQNQSPAPPTQVTTNGTYVTNGISSLLASWEPSRPVPLTLKPVATPGNNPEWFKQQEMAWRERHYKSAKASKGLVPPGSMSNASHVDGHPAKWANKGGFFGPNIYIRCLLALQSRIPEEEAYALHHLVKISHERGDKYRFDGFPGLAEALVTKVLGVTELFYDVTLEISYEDCALRVDGSTVGGSPASSDFLTKLRSARVTHPGDDVETEDFAERLGKIKEAGLVLRNMVMLEENAEYISKLPLIRDAITIVLNLPRRSTVVELQHYVLEIAEQLTKYFALEPDDALYTSLLAQLDSADRGVILTILRAITRISMNLETTNRLENFPITALQKLSEWILIEDEDLRNTCLDFLYQFTALSKNVEILLHNTNIEGIVFHLVRLLMYNSRSELNKQPSRRLAKEKAFLAEHQSAVPRIPPDLVEDLLTYDEPERSSQWLRCCFEEDAAGEITQILLWQAYQSVFVEFSPTKPLLPAKDFITNVSTTFAGATAQVLNSANPKFIIKGIVPRKVPVDTRGRPYMKCLWETPPMPWASVPMVCGEFALKPQQMWEHIVATHLQIPKGADGKYILTKAEPDAAVSVSIETPYLPPPAVNGYRCRWGRCNRFATQDGSGNGTAYEVGMHIKTHLPDGRTDKASLKRKHATACGEEGAKSSHTVRSWPMKNTATDERNDAAGLPLTSALVLRNLAKGIGKIENELSRRGGRKSIGRSSSAETETEDGALIQKIFGPVREQLFSVMAYNSTLKEYLSKLASAIAAAEGS